MGSLTFTHDKDFTYKYMEYVYVAAFSSSYFQIWIGKNGIVKHLNFYIVGLIMAVNPVGMR